MADFTLCMGTRNTSSWSLRAYLALAHTGVPFHEVFIDLNAPNARERIQAYSSSGKVPVLRHGDVIIWESLAICEYANEVFPEAHLWPEDRVTRALGRAIASEVHAEFKAMRKEMPQDICGRHPGKTFGAAVQTDIDRVLTLWRQCRSRHVHRGPFLLGEFSIVDAMFAPIVTRFVTYDVPLDGNARAYMDTMLGLPALQRWTREAEEEQRASAP